MAVLLMQGHSVTRKLNSDGKVDTSQILHNLNEGLFLMPAMIIFVCVFLDAHVHQDYYLRFFPDELAGFDEDWKGNAKKHMPNWRDEFDKQGSASK